MRGTTFEPEVITPALEFGMLADRALKAVWRIDKHQPLASNDVRALVNARSFLTKARTGGQVLATRSMRNYTFEAMSAYEAVVNAAPEALKISEKEVPKAEQFLQEVDQWLEAASKHEPLDQPCLESLTRFFQSVVTWCLRTTVRPLENVSY